MCYTIYTMKTSNKARYTTQLGRARHSARPGRESLSKRLGKIARQIKARDNYACVYCGVSAADANGHLHLDHLTPRSKGGEDIARNLVLACRRCNCVRKNMALATWARYAAEHLGLTFTARRVRGQARRRLPELARAS